MFKNLSESKDFPPGKRLNALSYTARQKQFEMGLPEWQTSYHSATHILHNNKPLNNNKSIHENRNKSHFTFVCEDLSYNNYFTSEKTDKYRDNFAKREPNKQINKLDILKTTLSLGTDQNNYQTQFKDNFYDKSCIRLPEIQWKPQRIRYDIVTNEDTRKDRLEKACAFDFWNEEKEKKRVSRNYSLIPKDNEVLDVITGKIKRRNL